MCLLTAAPKQWHIILKLKKWGPYAIFLELKLYPYMRALSFWSFSTIGLEKSLKASRIGSSCGRNSEGMDARPWLPINSSGTEGLVFSTYGLSEAIDMFPPSTEIYGVCAVPLYSKSLFISYSSSCFIWLMSTDYWLILEISGSFCKLSIGEIITGWTFETCGGS